MKRKFPCTLAGVLLLAASAAAKSQQPLNVPSATAPGAPPYAPPAAAGSAPAQPAGGYAQPPPQPNYPPQQPQGYAPPGGYVAPPAQGIQQPAPTGAYAQPAANAAAAGAGYATGAAVQQAPYPAAQPPGVSAEAQATPYHVHRDVHNGHDHVYPDRGSVVRELPHAALQINYAGVAYRFYEGVWYEPRGPAFIVVAPPIGLIVSTLPAFATELTVGGQAFFYADEIYYLPRPDLGGYEVVNDPTQTPPATAPPAQLASAAAPVAAVAATAAVPAVAAATVTPAQLPSSVRVYAYPRNGQSTEQQARDQYDCYRFAASQTGMDPMRTGAAQAATARDADFQRAEAACLDGRGYTVH